MRSRNRRLDSFTPANSTRFQEHHRVLEATTIPFLTHITAHAIRTMTDHTRTIFESAKVMFSHSVVGLRDLQWEQLPQAVLDFLQANPGISAFQLVCLLAIAVPGLIATPALLSLGFGSSGPMAGRWLPSQQARGISTDIKSRLACSCLSINIWHSCRFFCASECRDGRVGGGDRQWCRAVRCIRCWGCCRGA